MVDSIEDIIIISQFMPKVKEASKQHSIEEIIVKILQQKGNIVQFFIEIGFLFIEADREIFINEWHKIDNQILVIRKMIMREVRGDICNQCSSAVKNDEAHKIY